MSRVVTNLLYLITIVAFILALRFLSSPATARRGNWIGAAGMLVVAVPNAHYPPPADALALADLVVHSLDEVTPELIRE